jgi:hypothetical protein
MPWPDNPPYKSIDDLLSGLLALGSKEKPVACRGQADADILSLETSIDRLLDPKADYTAKLAEERDILDKFRIRAREYCGVLEARYLNGAHANDNITALAILQHYHAPTRLIDWSASPWVALYFAAIHHHDKDGAIWWFKQEAFETEVGKRWDNEYNMKRYPPKDEVNLNDTAFNSDGPAWITKLHYPIPFHRIEVQQGFFTVAGRLGFEHSGLIADVLKKGECGRIKIPYQWKQQILDRLRTMNIHSKSLDYPGADIVGIDLRRDLKNA